MPARTIGKDGPHPIDIYVGSRLRTRRTLLGLSQEGIAERLGLTFQQLQKYEKGSNRISAGRLFELSQILNVPVSYFYEDMPKNLPNQRRTKSKKTNEDSDPMTKRETLELIRAYYRIQSPEIREEIRALAKSLEKR